MDIHQTLNWRAVWPVLAALPADSPIALVDAGCGNGAWCRRVARLRPRWAVSGIDIDAGKIADARAEETRAPLGNVSYIDGDFVQGIPGSYDVILSIASLHYAAAEGRGADALRAFSAALAPGGRAVLVVPRRRDDQPAWRRLPRPRSWPVFTASEMGALAAAANLTVREIRSLYGPWCMLGKQVAMWGERSLAHRVAAAPFQRLVRGLPADLLRDVARPGYALRVVMER